MMRVLAVAGLFLSLCTAPAGAATAAAEGPATEPAPVMQDNPLPSAARSQPQPPAAKAVQPGTAPPIPILTAPTDPGGARAPLPPSLILPGRAPPPEPPPKGGELAGYWTGTWTKLTDELPVAVTFVKNAGGYAGYFDSDALHVAGIPFSEVNYREPHARFVLKGDATTAVFEGAVSVDVIKGTFSEGMTGGTFRLQRGVAPEAGIRVREVSFQSGNVTLSGTLLLPPPQPQRYRAIVFLQGSGAEGRWANRYLAQRFASRGVVALIYDKRGVGRSTGDWRTATFSDLANDAAAAVRFLQAQAGIHPDNVGIYGHSQGGTIAPLVAERVANLEFIIASAASGLRPDRVEEFSVRNSINIATLPRAEQTDAEAYIKEIVAVAYRGRNRAGLDAMTARFRGRSWFFEPPPPGDYYWTLSRTLMGYRPLLHWKNVECRVLLVHGKNDMRVPADASVNAIRAAIAEGRNAGQVVRTWVIPDADHTFAITTGTTRGGWPKRVPDYAQRLVNWILWDHGSEGTPER
jgi:alpha-beta hydrolase superfamily lysophospholipase